MINDKLKNILIYGAPGSGKTHLTCGIAKDKLTLLFDIDNGAGTIRNIPSDIQKNIIPLVYTEFKDLNNIYIMLKDKNTPEQWNKFFKDNNLTIKIDRPFEAVIIDSLSELQRKMTLELSPDSIEDSFKEPSKMKPLRIQDWGSVTKLMELVVSDSFGSLPLIFICTAHEQMIENDLIGETFGIPKIKGGLAYDIGKYFDLMGRLAFARTGQRVLYTKTQKKWQAKTRGKHEPVIVEPTMEDIL